MANNRLIELLTPVLKSLEGQESHAQIGPCYSALLELRTQRLADYQLRNAKKALDWLQQTGFFENNLGLKERGAFLGQFLDIAIQRSEGHSGDEIQFYGHYMLLRELGRGGAGVVYLGEDMDSGQRVAVKTLHYTVANDLGDKAIRESAASQQIQSPWCVSVLECFKDQQRQSWILVSEFVDGPDCATWLKELSSQLNNSALPITVSLLIIEQMLRGVAAAHKFGVIHQDIKPENFLIDGNMARKIKKYLDDNEDEGLVEFLIESRQRAWIKLSDFGLALARNVDISQSQSFFLSSLSEQNRGGSLLYMPPEQIDGRGLSRKTDVFPLGLIAYQVLTGFSVLQARGYSEDLRQEDLSDVNIIVAKIVNSNSDSSISTRTDPAVLSLPFHVANLITQMTSRQRDQRPSSEEALHKIEQLIDSPELLDQRQSPKFVTVAILALLVVIIAAVIAVQFLNPNTTPKPTPDKPAQPTQPTTVAKQEPKTDRKSSGDTTEQNKQSTSNSETLALAKRPMRFLEQIDFEKIQDLTENDYAENKRIVNAIHDGQLGYHYLLRKVNRSAVRRVLRANKVDCIFILAHSLEADCFADTNARQKVILSLDAIEKFSATDLDVLKTAHLYALSSDSLKAVDRPTLEVLNSLNCSVFLRALFTVPEDCEELLSFPGATQVQLGLSSLSDKACAAICSKPQRLIDLPNIRELTPETFAKLVNSAAILRLNRLEKLPALRELPAKALQSFSAASLRRITVDSAEVLSKLSRQLELSGVKALEPRAFESLKQVPIIELGLQEVNEDLALELSQFKGVELHLPQLYSVTNAEFALLSRNSRVLLPAHLELRRQARITTKTALIQCDELIRSNQEIPRFLIQNLPSLELKTARAILAKPPQQLCLSACSEIQQQAWKILENYDGHLSLGFQALNSNVVTRLSRSGFKSLTLTGLTEASAEQLTKLLKFKDKADLSLPSFTELEASHLKALTTHCRRLRLDGVWQIDVEAVSGIQTGTLRSLSLRSLRELNLPLAKALANVEDLDLSSLRSLNVEQAKALTNNGLNRKLRIYLPPLSRCQTEALAELAKVTHSFICRPFDGGFTEQYGPLLSCKQVQLPNIEVGARLASALEKAGAIEVVIDSSYQTGQAMHRIGLSRALLCSNGLFSDVDQAIKSLRSSPDVLKPLTLGRASAIKTLVPTIEVTKRVNVDNEQHDNIVRGLLEQGQVDWLGCARQAKQSQLINVVSSPSLDLNLDQIVDFSDLKNVPQNRLSGRTVTLGKVTELNSDVTEFLSSIKFQKLRLPALTKLSVSRVAKLEGQFQTISLPALRKLSLTEAKALKIFTSIGLDAISFPTPELLKALCDRKDQLQSLSLGAMTEIDSAQWQALKAKQLSFARLTDFVDEVSAHRTKFDRLTMSQFKELDGRLGNVLAQSSKSLILPSLTNVSADTIKSLKAVTEELNLGLIWLSKPQAEAISSLNCKILRLPKLTGMDPQAWPIMKTLASKKAIYLRREFQYAGAFLSSDWTSDSPQLKQRISEVSKLESLSTAVAKQILNLGQVPNMPKLKKLELGALEELIKSPILRLNLPNLNADQVAVLAKCRSNRLELNGLQSLSKADLAIFRQARTSLTLNSLTRCEVSLLQACAQSCLDLELNQFKTLSAAQAERLAQAELQRLSLNGMTSLLPATAEALKSIPELSFQRLKVVSKRLAEALANSTLAQSYLDIRNVEVFAPGAMKSLAKHRGSLVLPNLNSLTGDDINDLKAFTGELIFSGRQSLRVLNTRAFSEFKARSVQFDGLSHDIETRTYEALIACQSRIYLENSSLRQALLTRQQFRRERHVQLQNYALDLASIREQTKLSKSLRSSVRSLQDWQSQRLNRAFDEQIFADEIDLNSGILLSLRKDFEPRVLFGAGAISPRNLSVLSRDRQHLIIFRNNLSQRQYQAIGLHTHETSFLMPRLNTQFQRTIPQLYCEKLALVHLIGLSRQQAAALAKRRQSRLKLVYPHYVTPGAMIAFKGYPNKLAIRTAELFSEQLNNLLKLGIRSLDLEYHESTPDLLAVRNLKNTKTTTLKFRMLKTLSDAETKNLLSYGGRLELNIESLSLEQAKLLSRLGPRLIIVQLKPLGQDVVQTLKAGKVRFDD